VWWIYLAAGIAIVVLINLLVLVAMTTRARQHDEEE
jgi:hypothetical protein